MKKLQFFSLALAFLLVAVLVSAATPTINASVTLDPASGEPGEVLTGTLEVNNTNVTDAVTVAYELLTFEKGAETFSVNINGFISNIAANGGVGTDDFEITIPQKEYGSYQGTLTVTDTEDGENTVDVPVNLYIEPVSALNVLETSYTLKGQPETTTNSKTISIKNTGTVSLSSVSFSAGSSDLSDSEGNAITVNYPSAGSIAVGATETFDFDATIPKDMKTGNYWVEITAEEGTASDTFTLNIEVQPELCGLSADDSILKIEVDEPDENGVDYYPGEEIEIDVNVENTGEDNLDDIVVEACLYNDDGDEVICEESEEQDIDEDEDFSFSLEIPSDEDEMDKGDYYLYIFAYEDKDEICTVVEEVVDIDFKRESHQVIAKEIQVSPRTASPGDTVSFVVRLFNAGTNDEDGVYVVVRENYLKVDAQSGFYELEAYDEDDNTATARLSVVIPEDAQNKDYRFEVIVYYDDGEEDKGYVETVTVTGAVEQIAESTEDDEVLSTDEEDTTETSDVTGAVTFYPTSKISSWIGDGTQSTIFWIIGDIVLVIVAIYFITLIFRNRR